MATNTYVVGEVSIVAAGHIMTGLADGSFVDVEYNSDRITMQKGADGEVARVINSDDSGRITIRLQQTSASNDALTALHVADLVSHSGAFPISIRDHSGNTLAISASAWITKLPTVSFGTKVEEREWVIECGSLAVIVGGN